MTKQDLYYLKAILRRLRQYQDMEADAIEEVGIRLGDMAMEDEIDYLDCLIDQHERALS